MSEGHGTVVAMAPTDVPPLTLVSGPEDVLVDRELQAVVTRARAASMDVVRLEATSYEPGSVLVHASPSLFGGETCIIVRGLHEAPDELLDDLLSLLATPTPDVRLVVTHASGQRGKKVLDTLKQHGARTVTCPAIKTDRDKSDFVQQEFARARRKITTDGVRALVEAVGRDVSELASACAQLIADTEGVVTDATVDTYHGGKVDATGFRVADAAIAGNAPEALRLLRHAIASGLDPVPIVAVLASQLRGLIKVGAAGRGSPEQLAGQVGMAPWQVKRARAALSHWSGEGLATALQAVAAADFAVKGGGRDPVYAVERAILSITRARSEA